MIKVQLPIGLALVSAFTMGTCTDEPRAIPVTPGTQSTEAAARTKAYSQVVPAETPDTVPASFTDDAMLVEDDYGDLVSTTMLAVYFETDTTQPQKQAAVDLVSGTVIGGVAMFGGGVYYVQVNGDSTIATIDSIAGLLRELPQVEDAYAERYIRFGH